MKSFLIFASFCLLWLNMVAQVPQAFKYQAVARNASGEVLAGKSVTFLISILQGSVIGTQVYSELHSKTTNNFGLVDLDIGKGNSPTGSFESISWGGGTYFMKVELDPAGGSTYQTMGTIQLLSVPYALFAGKAGNGFSGSYPDLSNKPALFSGNYHDLLNKPVIFDGSWVNLTGKPATLGGYGITDGMSTAHAANSITSNMITNWNTAYGWGNHAGL